MHMSNYLENAVLDWLLRGQTFTPPSNLYVGLCTGAPADGSNAFEVSTSGTGYARVAVPTSLTAWAGTQSAGSTTASSGSSGQTSNNADIQFPAPTGSWGTITHFVVYDAASGGNLWFWGAITPNRLVSTSDNVFVPAGDLLFSFSGGYANYLKNKLIDFLFRGQSYTPPAGIYVGLATDVPTATVQGSEPSGNAYARVAVTSALSNWAGTQSVGSTAVSSGTGGTTSNNNAVAFPTPTGAGWGTIESTELWDASSGGNRMFFSELVASKSAGAGQVISFEPATLTYQVDN